MKRVASILVAGVLCLILASCTITPTDPGNGGGSDAIPTTSVSGMLDGTAGATVSPGDLRVLTFAGSADLDTSGAFTVDVVDSDTYQWLLFVSQSTGNPIYIGLYSPTARAVAASDTSTALALALASPHLVYTDHTDREDYLDAVQADDAFAAIMTNLQSAYQSDAETALDYDSNTVLYQLVADLTKSTMEDLGSRGGRLDPPHIEDLAGDDVAFVNPRHIWYAAGIYDGYTLLDVATVDRDAAPGYAWGWPPTITIDAEETTYALGDGSFYICMARGDDFSSISDWDDPAGRATALNTGQSILHIVELLTGYTCTCSLSDLADYVSISSLYANELELDLEQGEAERFVAHFCEFMTGSSDDVAEWLWEGDVPSSAPEDFLGAAGEIFGSASFVLDLLSLVNTEGPFFWDWAYADQDLCYDLTQESGIITSIDDMFPPQARFSIDPPAGIVGTSFTFDPALTTDDKDPIGDLEFRWDWNSDGVWDTGWTSTQIATHSYSQTDAYVVMMQAKDTDGLVGTKTHNLNVGGGAGTADHVKLFRDAYPWSSNATVAVLEALGFTEGTGEDTYEIIPSSQMATVDLVPGEDLVIICNDQPQSFYGNYAASQVRFNNFVYTGGALLWEACDEGWNYGSMGDAGITLPGDVQPSFDYDWYNYVTDQALPLVSGLPDVMDHNYASHESFSNLPDGTTVYCIDESSNPTLIEYSLGGGWVVMSGQPLEHQYDYVYGSPDMEELLPRIVSYFTGVAMPPLRPVVGGAEPAAPSCPR